MQNAFEGMKELLVQLVQSIHLAASGSPRNTEKYKSTNRKDDSKLIEISSAFSSMQETWLCPLFIGETALEIQSATDTGSSLIQPCLYVSIPLSVYAGWHLWPCQGVR